MISTATSRCRQTAIMPTREVEAEDRRELQDVADALARSKKVIVVTGAGISTNTGIPVRDLIQSNGQSNVADLTHHLGLPLRRWLVFADPGPIRLRCPGKIGVIHSTLDPLKHSCDII